MTATGEWHRSKKKRPESLTVGTVEVVVSYDGASVWLSPDTLPRPIQLETLLRYVNVVGSTASGKTTMARLLSQRLSIPHLELDTYRWDPTWIKVPNDVFRFHIAEAARLAPVSHAGSSTTIAQ